MTLDNEEPEWIELSVPGASLAMASDGPVGYGHPARVRLNAGEVRLERRCEFVDLPTFCNRLSVLHATLSGRAELNSLDRDVALSLTAHDHGHVQIAAKFAERIGGPFDYDFNVTFEIDQSYLPSLLSRLKAEFLNRARP
ncbi:hypothetical protein [Phenylobacterium sp.]|uniref:WapI family immunity protein n=1 Tax=Phenylobacterium sp. TaxID=1871053 RepID=UPI0027360887|nr:hypothetical protein [Phenylobacterium sp.]MDP3658984.1 hypothetical protein [Phenylobacterium sp.]